MPKYIVLLIFLCLFSAGCAGLNIRTFDCKALTADSNFNNVYMKISKESKSTGGVGTYFKDRLNDFVDIFSLSLSLGIGVQANVRVTQIVEAGGLFWGGSKFGFIGRQGGAWEETVAEFGMPGFYIRSVQITPASGNIEPANTERGQSLWIFCGDEGIPYDSGYDRKFWQVGATAHAGLVGLDFSVNLKELFDFLLGWTTLDISNDDTGNRPGPEEDSKR